MHEFPDQSGSIWRYAQTVGDADALLLVTDAAHIRWGIVALQQGERHASGQEPSLEPSFTSTIS